jgi:hypothetical protein
MKIGDSKDLPNASPSIPPLLIIPTILLPSISPVPCGSYRLSTPSKIKSASMKNSLVGNSVAGSATLQGSAIGRLVVLRARLGILKFWVGEGLAFAEEIGGW